MSDRWSVAQVLALAPDPAAQRAAHGLAGPRPWSEAGWAPDADAVWGYCAGSGSTPYQTCVDLAGPAYRCSCPSRKIPCKHALALLLRWAGGDIPAGEPPEWVMEWQRARHERQTRAAERASTERDPDRPPSASRVRTAQQRADRVAAGVAELDRWLTDQIRGGLAGAARAGYAHWDRMAARLVDAQAPGLAGSVKRLAGYASTPERLLSELALLRLLIQAHRRVDALPEELAATVRTRVGYPVAVEDVLARPPVRDRWLVTGVQEEGEEKLSVRRSWLHGTETGMPALVLVFGPPGQLPPGDLILGTTLDADVCFYPGAQPLRAIVAQRYAAPTPVPAAEGVPVAAALDGLATALAADPWLDRWPVLLGGVVPTRAGSTWHLVDAQGDGLPLAPSVAEPWPLVSACAGRPSTIAAQWTASGLRPSAVWSDDRAVRV